jgi:hypothetical protein
VIADCGKLGGEISPPDPDNGEIRVLAWHDTNEDTVFSYGEVAGSGINVELVSDTIPPKAVSLPTKSNGLAVFNVPFDPAKTMQPCYTIHLMNPDFDTPHLTNNGTNPSTTVCPFISPGSVNTVHFPTRLQAAGPTPVPPAP